MSDLTHHIDAITAILADRADAAATKVRAWLSSLPAATRALTDEERDAIKRGEADHAAGNFSPSEEFMLRLALRWVNEEIAPRVGVPDERGEKALAAIVSAMTNAADYIHDRRLYVAPEAPNDTGKESDR